VRSTTAAAATPATASQTPVAASDADMLQIPGIDTKAALRRTGGDRRRYESLLRRFAESQAGTVEEIRAALAVRDVSTAERAAHSLKGAAGNLGATALADVAAKAEAAVKSEAGIEAALDSLAISLRGVLEAISFALPSEQPTDGAGEVSGDPAIVLEPLTRLKKLLNKDDGAAADFILDARPNLSQVLTRAEIGDLTGLVGNFDFEAALKCLSAIAARLSLKLE
jgi:two-component system sensor histidine kinase/response regulator